MISIILPTRGRPESFKKMCFSVLENASEPNDIEFVSYHDNDDPSIYEYIGNHREIVANRIIYSQMFNECYKIAAGPIYMFAADDMVFYTPEWDKRVKEVFDQSVDKIIFVHPNDGYYRSTLGVFGFLHQNWIETVGYFIPPYFPAGLVDWWINDLANNIHRRVFLREVRLRHLSLHEDQTHREYDQNTKNSIEIYHSAEKQDERVRGAQLLQSFIDNFKTT